MQLVDVIRNSLPGAPTAPNETCASCGQPFHCGASLRGCWCTELKLSDARRVELRQRFRGCLCRACLAKFAEKSS